MLLIDDKGKLYELLRRDTDSRVVVIDRTSNNPTLRNGSKIEKVLRVWQTGGPYSDEERTDLIEAITSYGQTVFATRGKKDT